MNAAIYTRVSTDEQKNNYSLMSQRRICIDYIKQSGHLFYKEYQDDGYSGSNLDRPAIQQLIKDIETKTIDMLVFLCLDRLTRNPKDLQFFIELVDKTNLGFISVQEQFDTTSPVGVYQMHQMVAFAQWERNHITERMMMGKEQKAREGKYLSAIPPYGYHYDSKRTELIINEEEAKIILWIFTTYLTMGLGFICRELNKKGVKTRRDKWWNESSIRYILKNPVYTGKMRWAYQSKRECIISTGTHKSIIDIKTFNAAQQLLKKRTFTRTNTMSNYIFKGILKCNRCGALLIGNRDRISDGSYSYYYVCRGRIRGICKLPNAQEKILEKSFLEIDLLFNQKIKVNQMNLGQTNNWTKIEESITARKNELKRNKARRKQWHINHADSLIDDEEYRELILESKDTEKLLNEEIEELLKELDSKPNYSMQEFTREFAEIKKMWDKMTRKEKKEIIETIFKNIFVDSPLKKKLVDRCNPFNIVTFSIK